MKTPQIPAPTLATALGLTTEVWLKREDLHKSGSHKGRSIPLMIKEYARQGERSFVISSSGNAALAAIIDIENHNKNRPADLAHLEVFVGQHIDPTKEQKLRQAIHDEKIITLTKTDNPKQAAFKKSKEGARLLRQSTDELALRGYTELAQELAKIPNLAAIFLPASSGTTTEGLFQGFKQSNLPLPQIHIAQTPNCHPLISAIYIQQQRELPTTDVSEPSLATSIVDVVAHRTAKVTAAIIESGGNGWIITNKEITTAQELVKKHIDIDISTTSALSIAALQQALATGWKPVGPVVCLITGA
jgi:threonine synthase